MAGIYSRDQINYGGMLGNAMQNRARQIERDYDNYMRQPTAWANALNQAGQTIGNAFNQAAQYQYNKDQLAAQQQFQSEQNALNRANQLQLQREREADALKRAQEQQKWQAEQNRLQRESTERIAGMSRADGLEERTAQNIMNYKNAEAVFNQYQTEFDNTDASTADGIMKRAKLQSLMEQERNKMNYYEGKIPVELRPKPEGTPVIVGEDAEKALAMFDSEQPQPQAPAGNDGDLRAPAVRLTDYISAGENAKKSGEVAKAIEGLNSIDTKRLTGAEQQKLADNRNKLIAKLEQLKKSEKNEADYQAALKAAGNNAFKRAEVKKKYGRK